MTGPGARLKLLDPVLRQVLDDASEPARRRAALTVSKLAVDRAGITDPRIGAALERLQGGGYGDSSERSAVQALTEELDEAAWNVQDRVEAGTADKADYVNAFARARAANAVWYALDRDPLEAAAEATYEASAAIGDPEAVSTAIHDSLS
jgi:hypothetical protein